MKETHSKLVIQANHLGLVLINLTILYPLHVRAPQFQVNSYGHRYTRLPGCSEELQL